MAEEFDKSVFADNMEAARNKAKMTQKELADKVGLALNTISSYANRQKAPTLDNAYKIASALNVTVDELCGMRKSNTISTYTDVLKCLVLVVDKLKAMISSYNNSDDKYIAISNKTVQGFLSDWAKVYDLYRANTIDDELYQAWKEKKWNDYNTPLYDGNGCIIDIQIPSDDPDDVLPF